MRLTPADELARRVSELQKLLQKKNIDGALIMQSADLFYFAGTAQRAHLYIPAWGKPLLLVKRSFARATQESALEDIMSLDNIKELPRILNNSGFKDIKILGLELDVLPAAQYLRYQKLFAPAQIVDISGLIRAVRMVKSACELDLIRAAARLNHTLFSQVQDFLQEGITELELASQLEAVFRRAGHQGFVRMRGFNQEIFYGHIMSGTNLAIQSSIDSPTGGPGVNVSFPQGAGYKKIARDEPVLVDYVAVYDGYMADQSRIFCLGRLSNKLVQAYETAVEIQETIKKMAVPGASCEDLYQCAVDMAVASGYGEYFMGYPEPVPFIGHGVGIELNEWPVLAAGFKMPLEEGMVIALEPKFIFPEGAVGIENTFVVGKKGLETLTVFDEQIIYLG